MLSPARYIHWALQLWQRRRTQAALSTLGITVGITGLILVIAIGEGARRELQAAVGALGAGTVIVRNTAEPGTAPILTTEKAQRILRLTQRRQAHVVPVRRAQSTIASQSTTLESAGLVGTSRNYASLHGITLHGGRFLTAADDRNRQRVCVLSWEAAKALFPRGQVLGQKLRIANEWYTVVGWLANRSTTLPQIEALSLTSSPHTLYLPLNAPAFAIQQHALDELLVRFKDESQLMQALPVIERVFERLQPEPAVEYIVPIALLRHKQRVQQLFQYLLLGVAGIMLLVGGVGIMNIMLFNVIARRAEIGLRRAIGATRTDIAWQFATESMVITALGGLAGIVLGWLCTFIIGATTTWQLAFSGNAALLGAVASLVIGGIFGSYPALQAAAVSPVHSLRNT